MSVQTELDTRLAKLRSILTRANTALSAKGVDAAADLDGVPAAIESISGSSTTLNYSWNESTLTLTVSEVNA